MLATWGSSSGFNPLTLFSLGEQGAWYDPSDLTTMFQDAAGTTPVTAVEQAVGRILDKSGRGNHASQSTSASRPVLRARYNLLTYSEEFDNAAWVKSNSTVSLPSVNGQVISFPAISSASNFSFLYQQASGASFSTGTSVVLSCDFKASTPSDVGKEIYLRLAVGANYYMVLVTLTSDWKRESFTYTTLTSDVSTSAIGVFGSNFGGKNTSAVAAAVRNIQFTTANDNTAINGAYQRIAAATDYVTTSTMGGQVFYPYLAFDGSDDSLVTNSVDFTGTDAMTVWGGVTKNSDAAQGAVVELSATIASNNGTFLLAAPDGATTTYGWDSKGTAQVDAVATSLTAPLTSVLTGTADISDDSCIIRVNGVQADSDAGDQGTGNYGNYSLFIGSRNQASLRFNGRIYSLIVRGATSTASQIGGTETWVAGKTGVTL